MRKRIIALCGFKGSGKDTVAKLLETCYNRHGKDVKLIAYADPIKETVMNIFNLRKIEEYDAFKRDQFQVNDQVSVSGRQIVRGIGMKMREYDSFQFVRYVSETIDKSTESVYIITDLRFQNEVRWCRLNGVQIVKVNRPTTTAENHITEKGIDDDVCQYILNNDGDMESLKQKVNELFNIIEKDYTK